MSKSLGYVGTMTGAVVTSCAGKNGKKEIEILPADIEMHVIRLDLAAVQDLEKMLTAWLVEEYLSEDKP